MEVYVEVEVSLHSFLASTLYGVSGQLHASAAVLRGNSLRFLLKMRLVGPEQQVLDAL